jgi:hypothetical protein
MSKGKLAQYKECANFNLLEQVLLKGSSEAQVQILKEKINSL